MKNTLLTTRHANAWTQREVNLIKTYVKRYPSNLSVAFEKVSELTGRSQHAVCQKYYNSVKDDGMLYVISSKTSSKVNQKNKVRRIQQRTYTIPVLAAAVKRLSFKQKIQLIKHLF